LKSTIITAQMQSTLQIGILAPFIWKISMLSMEEIMSSQLESESLEISQISLLELTFPQNSAEKLNVSLISPSIASLVNSRVLITPLESSLQRRRNNSRRITSCSKKVTDSSRHADAREIGKRNHLKFDSFRAYFVLTGLNREVFSTTLRRPS